MPFTPTASVYLETPLHAQDCPGYCGMGCATMIYDAFRRITPGRPYSQFENYKSVYKTPEVAGGLDGAYDCWHLGPWQVAQAASMSAESPSLPAIKFKTEHRSSALAGELDETINRSLAGGFPVIVLVGYGGAGDAKLHGSGTHWMVINGMSVNQGVVTGYHMCDPWRGLYSTLHDVERTSYTHGSTREGAISPVAHGSSVNNILPPSVTGIASGPGLLVNVTGPTLIPGLHLAGQRPETLAVWQRAWFRMQPHDPAASQSRTSDETRKLILGGIQTTGDAYLVAIDHNSGQPMPPGRLPNLFLPPPVVTISSNTGVGAPSGGVGGGPGVPGGSPPPPPSPPSSPLQGTAAIPNTWPTWLSVIGGSEKLVPEQYIDALPDGSVPFQDYLVKRIGGRGVNYTLRVYPPTGNRRLIAWLTGNTLQGVAVVKHWPTINNNLPAPLRGPNGEAPANVKVYLGIKSIKTLADLMRYAPVGKGLIWTPCAVSLTPILPLHHLMFTIPAAVADKTRDVVIHAAVELNGNVHLRLMRSSKSGA